MKITPDIAERMRKIRVALGTLSIDELWERLYDIIAPIVRENIQAEACFAADTGARARIQELLEANNRYLERARVAEAKLAGIREKILTLQIEVRNGCPLARDHPTTGVLNGWCVGLTCDCDERHAAFEQVLAAIGSPP